jgi:peptidoglycan/LPS O-acetylase OafA/YrhL
MKERLYILDWIRVFVMFYIIFVWHIDDYAENIFLNNSTSLLTRLSLHVFVFLSSYLLSRNYVISEKKAIREFIKKRAIRLYPLYLLSLIMLLIISSISFKGFFAGIFLLNMILNVDLRTLWFISMIFNYYILLSIILYNYSLNKTIYISLIFWISCYILHKSLGIISPKLLTYYPSFLIGIICAKHIQIGLSWGESKIIQALSYASFCMYLFHRVIYWALLKFYTPETNIMIVVYLACVGIPSICLVSIGLQKGYDKINPLLFRV